MNFKSPTFFTKFNVLGTVSVVYLLVFTGSKLVECGFNMNFSDPDSIHYAARESAVLVSHWNWAYLSALAFRWRFPALTGTMTLSYFIHNAVLTILRNQKTPENNVSEHVWTQSVPQPLCPQLSLRFPLEAFFLRTLWRITLKGAVSSGCWSPSSVFLCICLTSAVSALCSTNQEISNWSLRAWSEKRPNVGTGLLDALFVAPLRIWYGITPQVLQ